MIQRLEHPVDGFAYYTQGLAELWPQKIAISAAIAGFTTTLGGDVFLVWLLCGLWALDFVFGFAEALRDGRFRCRTLGRGVLKLPTYCLYLILVGAVNISLSRALHVPMPMLDMFAGYLITTEAVSVVGHMIRLGLPMPATLHNLILRGQAKLQRRIESVLEDDDEEKPHGP